MAYLCFSLFLFVLCQLCLVKADSHSHLHKDVESSAHVHQSLTVRTDETFSCNKDNACDNGACCAKSGFCGYGPKYCGTNDESPNDICWSNCNARAECGQHAKTPGQTCPLNVCCSQYGFCGTTAEFCGDGCQSNCTQPSSGAKQGDVQKRLIGYYESWVVGQKCVGMEINAIPVESLTHVNYAFAYISPDTFEIGPMPGVEASTFADFTKLKERNGNVVLGISLGGWTFNDNGTDTQGVFSIMASTDSNRQKFIRNLLSFMKHYGFTAVDFDWEYPGTPDRQPEGVDTTHDGSNYVKLIEDTRTAFEDEPIPYEVSFTAPTSYWYLRFFDIEAMVKAANYMNFMTYDLHGTWDADSPIGNQVLAHTNLTEIQQALDLLWRNNIPPEKVNLGLGFYSRTFELRDPTCKTPGCPFKGGAQPGACSENSGTLSYREITEMLVSKDLQSTYDKAAGVKYLSWDEDQWASYDDSQTFQQKIKFANERGLGGTMLWALDQDTTNLDALRGVVYPQTLKSTNREADDVSFWEQQHPGACGTTTCGGNCKPGTIEMTTLKCPAGGNKPQKVCCPIAAAPDPGTCHWRGNPPYCNGQCHGGEVALASSTHGGNGHCRDGRQFYCCPIPDAIDGNGVNCGWKDKCSSDQTLMTFAGSWLEDIIPLAKYAGLVGPALANFLREVDLDNLREYCCSKEEAKVWKDCYWAGTTDKGFDSCDDNHCATGIEVELTTSPFGNAQTCSPRLERQRAFCCTPSSGESLFLPVPLDYLFPDPPDLGDTSPAFNLQVDDTWGTGHSLGEEDDPNEASFGFVVITSPDEVQVTLDKRDGSSWEVFDCNDSETEGEQTVRTLCSDGSPESNCHHIHRGFGVPGTILQMPPRCGPGKYAVAKSMVASANQSLPHHLNKRGLSGSTVYDLTFDYDFRRVPRDFGDTLMRIDFSNEEGYWDTIVNRPGHTNSKRDTTAFRQNRKRWLEEEWRDDYHGGALNKSDLHKRWFGADAIAWLAALLGIEKVNTKAELVHTVDETLSAILIDQQFGPCPVGPAQAQANIRATIDANIRVDTSFGLTMIVVLNPPESGKNFDISQSYLYFRNKGEIEVKFQLDAVATISYNSGDIKLIGLDNFPGATFRVPGVVTVGPNMAVYASADAVLSVAGHLEAQVTVARWDVQQTYPQMVQFPVKTLDEADNDGTQTVGEPAFDYSITATGEVTLHLKPTVTFGIVFDDRWKVPRCSVDLVLDGYITFHAQASITAAQNPCPFRYGIDAGTDIYAQVVAPPNFQWGGTHRLPIYEIPRKQITPNTCPEEEDTGRLMRRVDSGVFTHNGSAMATDGSLTSPGVLGSGITWPSGSAFLPTLQHSGLMKRDTHTLGPLITIPASFLACPPPEDSSSEACPVCVSQGVLTDGLKYKRMDEVAAACPLEPPVDRDTACSSSSLSKRGRGTKTMTLSWFQGDIFYSHYPSCSINDIPQGVPKWYAPASALGANGCPPTTEKVNKDPGSSGTVAGIPISEFATDHVFEVHLIGDFLEWLCQGSGRLKYTGVAGIPWPNGWQQPDPTWCAAVFGSHLDGFTFRLGPTDTVPTNFVENTATKLGSDNTAENRKLLGLYFKKTNNKKRDWTSANNIRHVKIPEGEANAVRAMSEHASVFHYLQNMLRDAWVNPSRGVELVADYFDRAFWVNPGQFPGTPLVRGPQPRGVTSWGLRTLWCYWIDNHLDRIEQKIKNWREAEKNIWEERVSPANAGSSQLAKNFWNNHMQSGGLASVDKMHFPRDPQFAVIPLPGSQASQTSTFERSRYEMWGTNGLGRLGL